MQQQHLAFEGPEKLNSFKKQTKICEYVNERFWFKNMEMCFPLQSWETEIEHSSVCAHVATGGLVSAHFKF